MTFVNAINRQAGQGLIETLIMTLIIFGTVVALLSFENTLAYNDSLTTQQNDATLLAANELEKLRDFQVLNPQVPYTAFSSIASGTTTSVGMNTTFTITWAVTQTASPLFDTVNVTVSWTDRRNVAQSIKLSTIIAGIDPSTSSSVM
jgi:Tfp pilus assembly protein PilV